MADINLYITLLENLKITFSSEEFKISKDTKAALKTPSLTSENKKKILELKTDILKTDFGRELIKNTKSVATYSIIFICLLCMIIGAISYFLYLCNNKSGSGSYSGSGSGSVNSKTTYSSNNRWLASDKNHAFSIRAIDLNNKNLRSIDDEICLQPDLSNNLILQKNCDDDNLRFIARPEGQLQKFKSKNDKSGNEYCLKPVNIDKKIPSDLIYTNTCNDNVAGDDNKSLRFTYESDGKIKHTKSDRCIYAKLTELGQKVILDKCEYGTKFELI